MARVIKKPYTITRKEEKEPINKLDKFQIAFLNAIKNMEEPPKPVKWWKPIKESFAPFDKQKDKYPLTVYGQKRHHFYRPHRLLKI